MAEFTDPRGPVDLGRGVRLRAPGLRGAAELQPPAPAGTRSTTVEDPTSALVEALDGAEMTEQALVTLDVSPVPGRAGGTTRGGVEEETEVVLDVPAPGEGRGQVLMAVHEGGVISWHVPRTTPGDTGTVRSGADGVQYAIALPELQPPVDDAARRQDDPGTRGLVGMAGRVLLKALVFPVASTVAGKVTVELVRRWEDRHRPSALRWFGPSDDPRVGSDVDTTDLADLAAGRGLLFVHGTFSTSATGFGQLSDDVLGRLADAYDRRVLALEHPSVASSPEDNVAWLRDHLAGGPPLDLDVVTHSRGGLVGRVLAGGVDAVPEVTINTLVFGATPNHGTLLADPDHVVAFLDRSTTLLNLAPPGAADVVQAAMEVILVGVKAVAAGGLEHLTGLTGMNPSSPWLAALNDAPLPGSTTLRGIAADFEPTGALRRAVKVRVKDAVVDRVMGDLANDMVVPTTGVSGSAHDPDSLVVDPLVFSPNDGVHHGNLFAQRRVQAHLGQWLPGG